MVKASKGPCAAWETDGQPIVARLKTENFPIWLIIVIQPIKIASKNEELDYEDLF